MLGPDEWKPNKPAGMRSAKLAPYTHHVFEECEISLTTVRAKPCGMWKPTLIVR